MKCSPQVVSQMLVVFIFMTDVRRHIVSAQEHLISRGIADFLSNEKCEIPPNVLCILLQPLGFTLTSAGAVPDTTCTRPYPKDEHITIPDPVGSFCALGFNTLREACTTTLRPTSYVDTETLCKPMEATLLDDVCKILSNWVGLTPSMHNNAKEMYEESCPQTCAGSTVKGHAHANKDCYDLYCGRKMLSALRQQSLAGAALPDSSVPTGGSGTAPEQPRQPASLAWTTAAAGGTRSTPAPAAATADQKTESVAGMTPEQQTERLAAGAPEQKTGGDAGTPEQRTGGGAGTPEQRTGGGAETAPVAAEEAQMSGEGGAEARTPATSPTDTATEPGVPAGVPAAVSPGSAAGRTSSSPAPALDSVEMPPPPSTGATPSPSPAPAAAAGSSAGAGVAPPFSEGNMVRPPGHRLAPSAGPQPAQGAAESAPRSHQTAQGSHQTAQGSHQTAQGSHQSAQGSHQTAQGSHQTAQGSDQSAQGSDQSAQGPDQTAQGSDQSAQGSDQSAQGSDQSARGPVSPGQGPVQPAAGLTPPGQGPAQPAQPAEESAQSAKESVQSGEESAPPPKESVQSSKEPAQSPKEPAQSPKEPAQSPKEPAQWPVSSTPPPMRGPTAPVQPGSAAARPAADGQPIPEQGGGIGPDYGGGLDNYEDEPAAADSGDDISISGPRPVYKAPSGTLPVDQQPGVGPYVGGALPGQGGDSNFFAYFLTAVVLCIVLYLMFHNKQKILALVIEGRSPGGRRRPHSSQYRRLDNSLEEAISSQQRQEVASSIVY